jgi:WhiB family redox-sensing transcriptional regulator
MSFAIAGGIVAGRPISDLTGTTSGIQVVLMVEREKHHMSTTPRSTQILLQDIDERPWAAYAACRDADPDLFFPASDDDADDALRVCAGCAVRPDCLHWAMEMRISYGVWGGTTERDRKRLRRRTA